MAPPRDSWMPIPSPMKVIQGEDNSGRWQDFSEAFSDYALVDSLYKEVPSVQMAKFRAVFGEENRTIIRNLEIGTQVNDAVDATGLNPCQQLKLTLEALEKRFRAHRNIIYQRYVLYRMKQNFGEMTKDFFERVSKQVKRCDFGAAAKQTLRDILVLGTAYPKAQEACFRESHAKLDAQRALQIIEMCEDNERTVKNIQVLKSVFPVIVVTTLS
ncbi:uncharacterized protein LOC108864073 [Galendromus occidentalis]|uniref:Uncharacterized protein LOC108864073 n=1 Tax=Galendromus occidentalis TaxID=34638 RepID=A0AAJ7L3C5_9ACAR|nr:uncharacterized protein LOC108864073 [Galendromus occidentalis]